MVREVEVVDSTLVIGDQLADLNRERQISGYFGSTSNERDPQKKRDLLTVGFRMAAVASGISLRTRKGSGRPA